MGDIQVQITRRNPCIQNKAKKINNPELVAGHVGWHTMWNNVICLVIGLSIYFLYPHIKFHSHRGGTCSNIYRRRGQLNMELIHTHTHYAIESRPVHLIYIVYREIIETSRHITCHSSKSTNVTTNINDGSVIFETACTAQGALRSAHN